MAGPEGLKFPDVSIHSSLSCADGILTAACLGMYCTSLVPDERFVAIIAAFVICNFCGRKNSLALPRIATRVMLEVPF